MNYKLFNCYQRKLSCLLVLTMSIFLLTSCGFKLRGWQNSKLHIDNLKLDYTHVSNTPWNNRFINGLINNLKANNINVTPYGFNHADPLLTKTGVKLNNDYTLELTSAEYTKKITSTGSSQLVAQYKLNFNANFNIYKKDTLILTNQVINAQRNYNYKQNQILGLDYEEETITNELITDVTNRLINQLVVATT